MVKFFFLFFIPFITLSCNKRDIFNVNFLTLGSFNMEWLGDGIDDNKPRTEEQLLLIAKILQLSDIEVLGVQEIENEAALNSIVTKMEGYNFCLSQHPSKQKLGVIHKDYIQIEVIGDYTPLSLIDFGYNTRPGFLVKVIKNDFDFLMMVVHLKSTSRYDSTIALREESRYQRNLQSKIISH